MNKTSNKVKNKGITLIALIITIIVLLILAGISISMLTSENGILKRSQEAKEKTEEASRKERADLDKIDELIGEATSIGETVKQVTDENPGKLETENEVHVINSIEDLVFFAYNVTNGNTYEGQTVKLGLSLDFNSSKSYVDPYRTDYGKYGYNGELKTLLTSGEGFIPIGTNSNESARENKSFKGTFDGNGKIIKNLYINRKIEDNKNDFIIGLFGNNYGTIKKLGIENCNNSGSLTTNGTNTCMVGGITGSNYKDIEECFVSGNIASVCNAKSRSGGICATSSSNTNIINCYNLATINCTGGEQANVSGGIAGGTNGKLSNCFNNGKTIITCNSDKEETFSFIGGIVGISHGNVENCYNLNTVEFNINLGKFYCGGICGELIGGVLKNCYNKGYINKLGLNCKANYIRLILGFAENCTASNCLSLNFDGYDIYNHDGHSNIDNFTKCDDDSNMPNILNILGEKFKLVSNDYPVLSWQVENN